MIPYQSEAFFRLILLLLVSGFLIRKPWSRSWPLTSIQQSPTPWHVRSERHWNSFHRPVLLFLPQWELVCFPGEWLIINPIVVAQSRTRASPVDTECVFNCCSHHLIPEIWVITIRDWFDCIRSPVWQTRAAVIEFGTSILREYSC